MIFFKIKNLSNALSVVFSLASLNHEGEVFKYRLIHILEIISAQCMKNCIMVEKVNTNIVVIITAGTTNLYTLCNSAS